MGVDPSDTHGVQVTYDEPMDLLGRSTGRSWLRSSHGGDTIMCADGTARGRLAGGGENVVACRHEVFGQLRLRDRLRIAHPFVVAPGDPSAGILAFAFLFGGLAAIAGAAVPGVFWHRGRVRPYGSGDAL